MVSSDFERALTASPTLFPWSMSDDGRLVQLTALSEADYRSASFLDARMHRIDPRFATVEWSELKSASARLKPNCNFIFHISHCGSTLISRLIGSHPMVHSLREPIILRMIQRNYFEDRLQPLFGLWSRKFYANQQVVVKATSYVNAIGDLLLDVVPDSKALLVFISPDDFIPLMLDGAMSDIHNHAASRFERLQAQGYLLAEQLSRLSAGELVAMSWWCEMHALSCLATKYQARTMWVDFDKFLSDQAEHFRSMTEHFAIAASEYDRIELDRLTQRYSKKLEVKYTPAFRRELIMESRRKFAEEVDRGLCWLEGNAVLPNLLGQR